MTTDSNNNFWPSFVNAQDTVRTILYRLSSQDLTPIATLAFGTDYNLLSLEQLQQQWQAQNWSSFPAIAFASDQELQGANGAFSSANNIIYLSRDFVATSSHDLIVDLLLEEYGHYLDSQISPVDSPGDEGAIFSALVQGTELSPLELAVLKTENDTTNLTLAGTNISVEQQIIGTQDTRTLVANLIDQPWSAIGWLSSEWNRTGQSGNIFGATGSLFLSPYHVLTAAHAIWDKAEYEASGNGYASDITVNFSQSGQERFYGTANVTNMVTFTSWTRDDNWQLNDSGDWVAQSRLGDVALLTLDRSIGDYVGYFEDSSNISPDLAISIPGYPVDLAESWRWQHGSSVAVADAPDISLYQDSGKIDLVSNGLLSYQLDTTGGQSGAPILHYDSNTATWHTVGVHVAGSKNYNVGVQLTNSKVSALANSIANSPAPEDLPDLIDYDFWFGTDNAAFTNESSQISSQNSDSLTIRPGEDFTVQSLIRNNGTATNDLPLTVTFYASVDPTIDSEDYLLGEVTLGEIAPFTYREAIASAPLPDLTPGDYYIGWSIDSDNDVAEFIE